MKLADIQKQYYEASAQVGSLARQMAFAALGIVWIFRIDSAGSPKLPRALVIVGLLAVISLVLDFLQYYLGAYQAKKLIDHKESELGIRQGDTAQIETEFTLNRDFNKLPIRCYHGKLVFLTACYLVLIPYLIYKIF